MVFGVAFYPLDAVRVYGEVGYAFYTDGGNEPWEFQFGVDYSPLNPSGPWGAPFFAVSGHLRQEVDFGGKRHAPDGLAVARRDGPIGPRRLPLSQRPERPVRVLPRARAAGRRRVLVRFLKDVFLEMGATGCLSARANHQVSSDAEW